MADCVACDLPVDLDADDTHYETTVWVKGPKRDGAVLREYTGRFMHGECVIMITNGVAPGTEPMFDV